MMKSRPSTPRALGPTAVAALSEDLRLACMRISRRVRFEGTEEIAPHQFSVLARLEGGPLTPRSLADVEKISPPSMTRTIGHLAQAALVERHDDPQDGRRILVELTATGRQALTAARARRGRWMSRRVAELSAGEQATLTEASEILQRIAAR